MHSIITSYLLQTGKCALPYIGFFNTGYNPAKIDIEGKQILPPAEEIIFSEETILLSPGLVNYIAVKKNIPGNEAESQLEKFCKYWKEKIEEGGKLCFDSFGCLQKNESGNIYFIRAENPLFLKAIPAEMIFRQSIPFKDLPGNKVIEAPSVNEYYNQVIVVKRSAWAMWVLILAVVALMGLFYHFYHYKFSTSGIGNQNKIDIKQAEKTYIELEK